MTIIHEKVLWAITSAVVTAVALCIGILLCQDRAGRPSPESQVYNFGERYVHDEVEYTFTVYNPLSVPLKVREIKSSCSCVILEEPPRFIPPKSSHQIPVRMTLSSESHLTESVITLFFANHAPIRLSIKGKVVRQLPDRISFGTIRNQDNLTKEFYLKSLSTESIQISEIRYDQRYFTVRHDRSKSNSRDVRISVSLNTEAPLGRFESRLEIFTEGSSTAKSVILEGHVLDILEINPSKILFGVMNNGEEKTATLTLTAPYGDAIQIEHIETFPKTLLRCNDVDMLIQSDSVQIPIVLQGSFETAILKGKIRIIAIVSGQRLTTEVEVYAMKGE